MARKGIIQHSIVIGNGQRKYFYGRTECEVQEKIKRYLKGKGRKFDTEFSDWLYAVKRYTIKESTFDRLETTYRTMIKDRFGNLGVENVDSKAIQTYINELTSRYSYSSIKKCYEALNEFYKYLVKYKIVYENPVICVTIPRREYCEVKEKEIVIPTKEEIQRFINATYNLDEYGHYKYNQVITQSIILVMYTGLRVGELLALKWSDVDLEQRKLFVKTTTARIKVRDKRKTEKYEIKDTKPKTKNGTRTVYLNSKAVEVLTNIRNLQNKGGTFVVQKDDERVTYAVLQKVLHRIQKDSSLPIHGMHLYRHYFASECLSLGIKPIELSRMLGHARVNITLDIYGHLTEAMNEDIKNKLECM